MNKNQHGYTLKVTDDLIEVHPVDSIPFASLMALKEEIIRLSKDKPRDILVDMGEIKTPDSGAWDGAADYFNGLPYKRYAIYGGAPAINLGTKELIATLPDSEHIKVFRREADARAWLQEA